MINELKLPYQVRLQSAEKLQRKQFCSFLFARNENENIKPTYMKIAERIKIKTHKATEFVSFELNLCKKTSVKAVHAQCDVNALRELRSLTFQINYATFAFR